MMRRFVPALLALGLAFTVAWENGWIAPTQIQYATTPSATWKTLAIVPAGDNEYASAADNNTTTRGRFYWFRERHLLDNGSATPWSKPHGAVWLTGPIPAGGAQMIGKTDNGIINLPR
ncbi:MAG TPA: hypothetical protein PK416_10695 [Thermodesulfobacteriota bacterium]|nr:hypothetical protein [Thermodesulfobacteriota bacterium]